ncbi:MAG: site-specific DNA-methyltransferase [Sulfuricellaceae bacterium]
MEKLKLHSPDLTQENIAKLAELFPNCVTEIKKDEGGRMKDERGAEGSSFSPHSSSLRYAIDFDLLRQELSGAIVEGPQERYQLNWPGKREALLTANAPIAKTLRPCREESVDFDTTQNLFIEGDNLDALKLLQETYLNKVKMIYIDPPYNTGNDFIYEDDFAEDSESYFERSNQKDEGGNRLVANTESNGRFHSDWLSLMYSRLKLARNLLRDDGVIFISIDDNEAANIRKLTDEVFGEQNFLGMFIIKSTPNARNYGHIAKMHEYCLMYGKNSLSTKSYEETVQGKEFKYKDEIGGFNIHPLYNSDESFHSKNRPNLYYPFYISSCASKNDEFIKISLEKSKFINIEVYPPKSHKNGVQFVWRWGKEKALENLNSEIIGYRNEQGEYRIVRKMRHTTQIVRSMLLNTEYSGRRGTAEVEELFKGKIFSFPKPVSLLTKFIEVTTAENDIVLDFFSGSATTAHAVMALNAEDGGRRKFIMVQIPEACGEKSDAFKKGYKTIAEIGKERIRRAGKKIKEELKSKDEGGRLKDEKSGGDSSFSLHPSSLDTGFRVLKIDSSNMKDVYYAPDAVKQGDLLAQVDNIREDRTAEDLLFQVLLDWGVDLALPITQETFIIKDEGGKDKVEGRRMTDEKDGAVKAENEGSSFIPHTSSFQVFFVDGNALAACFETGINEEFVKALAARHPLRAVFRDAGFASDSVKINIGQIFKLISPTTEVKSI